MWIGAAVMAALLVYVALRSPKKTAPALDNDAVAPETDAAERVAAH